MQKWFMTWPAKQRCWFISGAEFGGNVKIISLHVYASNDSEIIFQFFYSPLIYSVVAVA